MRQNRKMKVEMKIRDLLVFSLALLVFSSMGVHTLSAHAAEADKTAFERGQSFLEVEVKVGPLSYGDNTLNYVYTDFNLVSDRPEDLLQIEKLAQRSECVAKALEKMQSLDDSLLQDDSQLRIGLTVGVWLPEEDQKTPVLHDINRAHYTVEVEGRSYKGWSAPNCSPTSAEFSAILSEGIANDDEQQERKRRLRRSLEEALERGELEKR